MPNDPAPRPAPLSFADAMADIERRVARARVHTRPFPHVVIDDLLPLAVRRGLDRHWPGPDLLKYSNHLRRGEIRVSKLAQAAEGYEQGFWTAVRHLATRTNRAVRQRLQRHLHDKFRPLLGPDWRRRLGQPNYVDSDAMLAHYAGSLDMAPHIDNARVVINGFVYLDDPDMPTPEPRRGTMLYRSLGFSWPSNIPIPAKVHQNLLREAKDVAWRDNRLLAYINGPWSFHGVPKHELGDSRRRLLMFGTLLDSDTVERVFEEVIR